VKSMMDLYDSYDPDLLDEARAAAKPPWYRAYGLKELGYVDVETEAVQVHQFLPVDLPGLLQTEAHARALFRANGGLRQQDMDNGVAVRLIRKERLMVSEQPLELVAVVYEAALRRNVGGPSVAREQLRHLVEMAKLSTVTLQVLPLDGSSLLVPNATFILLGFPEPEDPELLYVEHPVGSLHIEKPEQVKAARLMFDQLRANALSPDHSVALIEQLARNLDGP
ncbi:MAG: DUF5753 domain-containing protein, partial [Kibdelosporangium sp.]